MWACMGPLTPHAHPAKSAGASPTYSQDRPETFNDCIHWARTKFEEYFNNNIQQLLFNFPVDTITNSGERFWSGPKRPPTPVSFDAADPTHLDFVAAAAHLRYSLVPLCPASDMHLVCHNSLHTPRRFLVRCN